MNQEKKQELSESFIKTGKQKPFDHFSFSDHFFRLIFCSCLSSIYMFLPSIFLFAVCNPIFYTLSADCHSHSLLNSNLPTYHKGFPVFLLQLPYCSLLSFGS